MKHVVMFSSGAGSWAAARRRAEISFSLRYGILGIYLDRSRRILHVYPLPFIRLSIRLS